MIKKCVQSGNVVDRLGPEKGYAAIREAGFEGIDWNLNNAFVAQNIFNGTYRGKCIFEKSLDEVIAHYAEELAVIRKNGLSISQAHAPFPTFSSRNPDVLDYCIELLKRYIEYCDYVDCRHLIIHPVNRYNIESGPKDQIAEESNEKIFSAIMPTLLACKNPVIVCLETLDIPCSDGTIEGDCWCVPEEAVAKIEALNSRAGKEVFGLCLDTGHLNLVGSKLSDYIIGVGKHLKALHIHDNDGDRDHHSAPIAGWINWRDFCDGLRISGYDGDLSFETFAQSDRALDFSEEMNMLWLKLISDIGEIFRKSILN